ncbi:uncharacterized protein LOC122170175 [Centrocercus urophasianus]|uniref:uncharacterized protein LOC122170175 n=1 Tax=Centrocercus urophasianus TaxID=9002 RepID=UPI001C652D6B|nr:uncharacterized protein LOC122170175 [Centrocercus urophasianus]
MGQRSQQGGRATASRLSHSPRPGDGDTTSPLSRCNIDPAGTQHGVPGTWRTCRGRQRRGRSCCSGCRRLPVLPGSPGLPAAGVGRAAVREEPRPRAALRGSRWNRRPQRAAASLPEQWLLTKNFQSPTYGTESVSGGLCCDLTPDEEETGERTEPLGERRSVRKVSAVPVVHSAARCPPLSARSPPSTAAPEEPQCAQSGAELREELRFSVSKMRRKRLKLHSLVGDHFEHSPEITPKLLQLQVIKFIRPL